MNEQSTKELDQAIIEARKEMSPIDKSQTSHRYKYASIDDIIDAIEDALGRNNLKVESKHVWEDGQDFFETSIKHAPTGQKTVTRRLFVPAEFDPKFPLT